MNKVVGIISWFPDTQPDRQQRISRLERLLAQLNNMWPSIPIMIIAQNWQGYSLKCQGKFFIHQYSVGLGILKARKELRKKFLESEFDYIILFDDDAIIKYDNEDLPLKYLEEIDKHPNGFCFIGRDPSKHTIDPYRPSQLNLCAISRYIFEKEDIPNVDPQKKEGFEDRIFSYLLHIKYSNYEFKPPEGIIHAHFRNKQEYVPSTWYKGIGIDVKAKMLTFTNEVINYIDRNKDIPERLK